MRNNYLRKIISDAKKQLFALAGLALLASCGPMYYYQLYQVEPSTSALQKNNELLYEDENCIIRYNLWSDGGNIGFDIENKTEKDLYLCLNKSFFVLNGMAFDYYQNRTFTTSESRSISTSASRTTSVGRVNEANGVQTNYTKHARINVGTITGNATTMVEDSVVCIPAGTYKTFTEYSINSDLIRDCDLLRNPRSREIKTKKYTLEQSPVVFGNIVTYKINNQYVRVNNEFYISEITNYPYTEFFESKYEENCGVRSRVPVRYYKYYNTNRFFIRYSGVPGSNYNRH